MAAEAERQEHAQPAIAMRARNALTAAMETVLLPASLAVSAAELAAGVLEAGALAATQLLLDFEQRIDPSIPLSVRVCAALRWPLNRLSQLRQGSLRIEPPYRATSSATAGCL